MLVAQISDTHLITPGGPGRFGDEKLIALEKCIEAINRLDTLPDVVIHTGDLSDSQFGKLQGVIGQLLG